MMPRKSAVPQGFTDVRRRRRAGNVSRPIFVICSTALIVVLSISSNSDGSATVSFAAIARPASSIESNVATNVLGGWAHAGIDERRPGGVDGRSRARGGAGCAEHKGAPSIQ